jgi:hypothetical protein
MLVMQRRESYADDPDVRMKERMVEKVGIFVDREDGRVYTLYNRRLWIGYFIAPSTVFLPPHMFIAAVTYYTPTSTSYQHQTSRAIEKNLIVDCTTPKARIRPNTY